MKFIAFHHISIKYSRCSARRGAFCTHTSHNTSHCTGLRQHGELDRRVFVNYRLHLRKAKKYKSENALCQ